jgi:hypothetical protein
MRFVWIVFMVCACADPPSPDEYFASLDARVTIDCGTHAYDTPRSNPRYICGPQPDVACINDALAGRGVARLVGEYVEPGPDMNRWGMTYFAVDGAIVEFAYSNWFDPIDGPIYSLSREDCTSVKTTSVDIDGATCWSISGVDCVDR